MSPEQLAKLLRDFLIRAEKRSALLLLTHFDRIKAELAAYLVDHGVHPGSIDAILKELERQIATRTVRFESIVTDRQDLVIKQLARTLNLYLQASIFDPDREAIAKLAGRASDGGSLTRILQRMQEPVRAAAREALLDGMAEGLGARQIAGKLNKAADLGYGRALTIARTETNEAVRAASREFYSAAGVKKYVWMAILDPRTCLICWRLHGTIWPSKKKVFSHPNCRCVLVPLKDGDPRIETGLERFAKLEPGFQKQILGPARFDLYKAGSKLMDFVGSEKSKEYGLRHFIKPLPAGIKPKPPSPPPPPPTGRRVPQFKGTKEAEIYFEKLYPGKTFDFVGIAVDLLNANLGTLHRLLKQYPQVAERLKYVGTYSGAKPIPGLGAKRFRGEVAHTFMEGHRLALNPSYFGDLERLKAVGKRSEEKGYWVSGDIDSTIIHEFGHDIDGWLRSKRSASAAFREKYERLSSILGRLRRSRGENRKAVIADLSEYAVEGKASEYEIMAEGFVAHYKRKKSKIGDLVGEFIEKSKKLKFDESAEEMEKRFAFLDRFKF